MIDANCPGCGSSQKKLLYRCRGELSIQQCRACTLQYLSPRLDEAKQRSLYDREDYYSCWALEDDDVAAAQTKKQTAIRILDLMEENQPQKGKLLEIGCAVGFFLQEAILRGWQSFGLDVSAPAIKQAKKRLGEKAVLLQGLLSEESFVDERFSAVVMLDVIEHIENPVEFLKQVRRKTSSSGLVYLLTPDTDSLSRRLLGQKWPHYKWEHLFYLGHKTAGKLLTDAGWRIIKIQSFTKPITFNYLKSHYQKFPHFPHTQIINFTSWLLPALFKRKIVSFPMGQMLIIAENPSSDASEPEAS